MLQLSAHSRGSTEDSLLIRCSGKKAFLSFRPRSEGLVLHHWATINVVQVVHRTNLEASICIIVILYKNMQKLCIHTQPSTP